MEFEKDQAIYLQIADLICENILSGQWAEESRIPSVRELAMSTEVNPNTVMRSYTWLQDKGIIQNQRGIGYFVLKGALDMTRELKKEDFIKNQLPHLFKMMKLLNISFGDLKSIYDQQQ